MNRKDVTTAINSLQEICSIEPLTTDELQDARTFGDQEYPIKILGRNNRLRFRESIDKIYKYKNLNKHYTQETLSKKVAELVGECLALGTQCTVNQSDSIYENLLKAESKEYSHICPIYGIRLDTETYSLGDFVIRTKASTVEYLSKIKGSDFFDGFMTDEYYVEIKSTAKESDKAQENSLALLNVFENVLKYSVSDVNRYNEPMINSRRDFWSRTTFTATINQVVVSTQSYEHRFDFMLDDGRCIEVKNGNNKLWRLITNSNNSDLEKRIINSVQWLGKSVYEQDDTQSLVMSIFALEGLLQLDKEKIVAPSILSHIGECIAFINTDDFSERLVTIEQFKRLYSKRSAAAHSAVNNITYTDRILAFRLARATIISLLTYEEFEGMNTMQDLMKWVEKRKFS